MYVSFIDDCETVDSSLKHGPGDQKHGAVTSPIAPWSHLLELPWYVLGNASELDGVNYSLW